MIKFLDHDDSSRITMDVVKGELLVNRAKSAPELTKNLVFSWFHNLLSQMIQYHKCYHNRSYRYLNPFSVVITEENEAYLLDIDASSNNFVLKHLQTPSMREHFLKTTIQPTEENKVRYDIYCFGKTIQYVLASSESFISLNKREESRLLRVVEKCFEENIKKGYSNFAQMKKDLSFTKVKKDVNVRKESSGEGSVELKNKKLKIILMTVLALIIANIILGFVLNGTFSGGDKGGAGGEISSETIEEDFDSDRNGEEGNTEERSDEERAEDERPAGAGNPRNNHEEEEPLPDERIAEDNLERLSEGEDSLDGILRSLDEDMNRLLGYLHQNDKESNQKIISQGEEMELIILRGLAMAYDREGYHELAIMAYGRLIGIEDREEHLERAILRKMKLEEELGLLEQALETGRAGLELHEGSLEIGRLILEVLINGGRASPQEVMREYERLKELIPELEDDEIRERIEGLE